MKRIGVILLGSISLAGCNFPGVLGPSVVGSGHLKTETRNVSRFHKIDIGGATIAEVKIGPKDSLAISADDNILPLVRTRVMDGTLVIDHKDNVSTSTKNPIKATITVTSLDGIQVSGAGRMSVTGLHTGKLEASLSGASQVKADGSAASLELSLSGASQIDFAHVSSQDAKIEESGASNAILNASRKISGELNGASHLRYAGHPQVDVSTSGASSVSRG